MCGDLGIISTKSTGLTVFLYGRINSQNYISLLSTQIQIIVEEFFPEAYANFENDDVQIDTYKGLTK